MDERDVDVCEVKTTERYYTRVFQFISYLTLSNRSPLNEVASPLRLCHSRSSSRLLCVQLHFLFVEQYLGTW